MYGTKPCPLIRLFPHSFNLKELDYETKSEMKHNKSIRVRAGRRAGEGREEASRMKERMEGSAVSSHCGGVVAGIAQGSEVERRKAGD